MLIVSESDARRLVTMADAIEVIDGVFRALHRQEAEVFPVVLGHGSNPTSMFSAKSGWIRHGGIVGLKVGSYWPSNRTRGLRSHGSTTLLLDDESGAPRALVAASHLTALRTAAADGVAVRRLSREDSRTVAIVGAGHQAWYELQAVCEVRRIERVNIWSRTASEALAFAARVSDELGLSAAALPIDQALRDADIIVTVTSAREPLVFRDHVRPGAHISAMGADARGKQEIDIKLVAAATAFADVVEQAISIGELQTAMASGAVRRESITTLGAVLCGAAPGRRSPDEITLFDSSGVALQDLAIGELALSRALRAGAAVEVDLEGGLA